MPFILVSDTQELLELVDKLERREDREPVMVLVVDHEAAEVLGAKLAEQSESRVVYVVSRTTADPLLPRLLDLAVTQEVHTEVVSRTAATLRVAQLHTGVINKPADNRGVLVVGGGVHGIAESFRKELQELAERVHSYRAVEPPEAARMSGPLRSKNARKKW